MKGKIGITYIGIIALFICTMVPAYDKFFNISCSIASFSVAFVDRNKISGKTFYLFKFIQILFHLTLSFLFLGRIGLSLFVLNFENGLTLKYAFQLYFLIFSLASFIFYLCILFWFKNGYIFDFVRIIKSLSNVPIAYNITYFRNLIRYRNFILFFFISCIVFGVISTVIPMFFKEISLELMIYFTNFLVSKNFFLWLLFYLAGFIQVFYYLIILLIFYLFFYPINEEMKRLYVFCKDTKNLLSLNNLTVAYYHHVKLCEAIDTFNKMFKHFIFISYFAFCPCVVLMLCVFINGGDEFIVAQQTLFTTWYKVLLCQTPICGVFVISILGAQINWMVHKPLPYLFQAVNNGNKKNNEWFHLMLNFVMKLSSTEIGFTVWDFTTITYALILTLCSIILSFITIIVNFNKLLQQPLSEGYINGTLFE